MSYKFEKLEVWQLALEYNDLMYSIADKLPRQEDFNLKSQLVRAATSIALNIAEGSTSQSDNEQARFLGLATRSLIETVACLRLITRRGYSIAGSLLEDAESKSNILFAKLQAFRQTLRPREVREETEAYRVGEV